MGGRRWRRGGGRWCGGLETLGEWCSRATKERLTRVMQMVADYRGVLQPQLHQLLARFQERLEPGGPIEAAIDPRELQSTNKSP